MSRPAPRVAIGGGSIERAAELRLWVAWWHCDNSHGTAIAAGDIDQLRTAYPNFDWHEKLIFSAILNLRGETL